jgi:hypothetical protein
MYFIGLQSQGGEWALVGAHKSRQQLSPHLREHANHYFPDARLIGIGAAVARGPLPHHRAYGSVHGGSSQLR